MTLRSMPKPNEGSLRTNFTYALFMVMVFTALAVMIIDYYLVNTRNTRMLRAEIEVKMDRSAQTLANPLWLYDNNFIQKFAEILANDISVARVTVIDERGKVLVDMENHEALQAPNTQQWDLARDIRFNDRDVGRLSMRFTNSTVHQLTRQMLVSDVIILVAVLLAVLGSAWFLLTRQVFAPLGALELTFRRISAGDYSRRVTPEIQNELSSIANEFNTMVDQIELREKKIRESEIKYRTLVESSTDIIFTTDLRGRLVYTNQNFEKVTGERVDSFIGEPFTRMFPEGYANDSLEKFRSALSGEKIALYEVEIGKRDGGRVPMELNLTIQTDINSLPVGALGIARDIANRKRSEKDLRKYERIIASTSDLMSLIDGDCRIQAVNDAYLRAYGTERDLIIGKPIEALAGSEQFERLVKPHVERCLTGENVRHQTWMSFPEIGRRFMDVTFYPNLEPDRTVSGVVISERDITERKELETQLHQTQKMEAIGTLAGGIAHDFNNILGAIIGYAEMIELFDVNGNASLAGRLKHILNGARRARDLVEQILTFSRHTEQEKNPLRLTPILKEALKFLRASIPSTIKIEETMEAAHDVVMANPTEMHQVLMNLCTNAAQAMALSGGTLSVKLRDIDLDAGAADIRADLPPGPCIEFSVSDTGPGIEPAVLDRIFDPFFTTKKPGEGTGMGLAVVHGIVNNHQGAVKVESSQGRGSTFRVYLPCLESVPVGEATIRTPPDPAAGRGSVLFVDDEEPLVNYSRDILNHLGYDVAATTSSTIARDLFFAEPDRFDLVITDQTMPDLTGLELARLILDRRPGIPVVLCTGFSTALTEDNVSDSGVRTVVKKPIGARELADLINRLIADRPVPE